MNKKKYGTFYGVTFPPGGEFEHAEYPFLTELAEDLGKAHGFDYPTVNRAMVGRETCEIGGLTITRIHKVKPGRWTVTRASGETTTHPNLADAVRALPGVKYANVWAAVEGCGGRAVTIEKGEHAGAKIARHKP